MPLPHSETTYTFYQDLIQALGIAHYHIGAKKAFDYAARYITSDDNIFRGIIIGNRAWQEGWMLGHIESDLQRLDIPYARGTAGDLVNPDPQVLNQFGIYWPADEIITISSDQLDIPVMNRRVQELLNARQRTADYLQEEAGLGKDMPFQFGIHHAIPGQPYWIGAGSKSQVARALRTIRQAVPEVIMAEDGTFLLVTEDILKQRARQVIEVLPPHKSSQFPVSAEAISDLQNELGRQLTQDIAILSGQSTRQIALPGTGRVVAIDFSSAGQSVRAKAAKAGFLQTLTQTTGLNITPATLDPIQQLLSGIINPDHALILPVHQLMAGAKSLHHAARQKHTLDTSGFESETITIQPEGLNVSVGYPYQWRKTEGQYTDIILNASDFFNADSEQARKFAVFMRQFNGIEADLRTGPNDEDLIHLHRNGQPLDGAAIAKWLEYAAAFTGTDAASKRLAAKLEREFMNHQNRTV